METVEVTVTHFYNHAIYYSFMPQTVYEALEIAYLNDLDKAQVPKDEFELMIDQYLDTLKN